MEVRQLLQSAHGWVMFLYFHDTPEEFVLNLLKGFKTAWEACSEMVRYVFNVWVSRITVLEKKVSANAFAPDAWLTKA